MFKYYMYNIASISQRYSNRKLKFLTLQIMTQRANDIAEFCFTYANISAKSEQYAKILQHVNNQHRLLESS